jgi:ABC-2 type transport system ATP-binding protein
LPAAFLPTDIVGTDCWRTQHRTESCAADQLKKNIGTSSLHLTVKNSDCADKAASIIERILGEKAQIAEGTELSAKLTHTNLLTGVLTALQDMQIELSAIDVRKPSLDEVFFALTGNIREADEKEAV